MNRKKQGRNLAMIQFILTIVLVLAIITFIRESTLTGQATISNQTNSLPVWIGDTTLIINSNSNLTIDLNNYFNDSDKDSLTYLAIEADKIILDLVENILTVIPEEDFVGERTISIIASDEFNTVKKEITLLIGTEQERTLALTNKQAIKEGTLQEVNISTISIKKAKHKITNRTDGKKDIEINNNNSKAIIKGLKKGINATIGKINNQKIKTEVFAAKTGKIEEAVITLAKTGRVNAIVKCEKIDLETLECSSGWEELNIPFADDGENITFTVTNFSGYAGAEIEILNIQSYPTLYGNWTVMFNTTGTANLTIKASNGTTWSNDNEDNDLKFLELKCGDTILNPEWINNSVFIQNYNCTQTSYETSKVLTTGKHTLQFTFGDNTAYAYNDVIDHCGVEINTSTTLSSDLSGSGTCITFNNNSITLDCAGYNITGDGTGNGIEVIGKINITIKNCNISNFNYGIRIDDTNNSIIYNNSFNNNNYGFYSAEGYYNNISSNTINYTAYFSLFINTGANNNISDNQVETAVFAGISLQNSDFNLIKNNIVQNITYLSITDTTGVGNRLENNSILNGHDGFSIASSYNTRLFNNTITDTDGSTVYLSKTKNITLEQNRITNSIQVAVADDGAIRLSLANTTIIKNNTIINSSKKDLNLTGSRNTQIINQNAKNYSFKEVYNLTIEKTNTAKIEFIAGSITQTGTNFSEDIQLNNNSVFINTTNAPGFNTSANITLHNIGFTNPRPRVKFNDNNQFEFCPTTICNELSFTGNTFIYNTTHFTTFSSEETPACGQTITNSTVLSQNLTGSGTCLTIGANDITLDCNGYNITGNNAGKGINISRKTNITIKNCNLYNFSDAAYLEHSNTTIINNITAAYNTNGIKLNYSNDNFINNSLLNNNFQSGIVADFSSNNTIFNTTSKLNVHTGIKLMKCLSHNITYCTLTNSSNDGIQLLHGSNNTFIMNNEIKYNYDDAIVFSVWNTNNTIKGNSIEGLGNTYASTGKCVHIKFDSSNTSIENNNLTNCNAYSIQLVSRSHATKIENNTITDASRAIHLQADINDTVIRNNTIKGCGQGVTIPGNAGVRRMIVRENRFMDISNSSFNNSDAESIFQERSAGIFISAALNGNEGTFENTIYNNTFENVSEGIIIWASSGSINISNNVFINNTEGAFETIGGRDIYLKDNTFSNNGDYSKTSMFEPTITNKTISNSSDNITITKYLPANSAVMVLVDAEKTSNNLSAYLHTIIKDSSGSSLNVYSSWIYAPVTKLHSIATIFEAGYYNITVYPNSLVSINSTGAGRLVARFSATNISIDVLPSVGTAYSIIKSSNISIENEVYNSNNKLLGIYVYNNSNVNFSNVSILNSKDSYVINSKNTLLTNTNLDANVIVQNTAFGSINFTQDINVTTIRNLTDIINITHNKIYVDTLTAPEFNKSAILTFKNISFTNPEPTIDPHDNGGFYTCPANICTERSYSNGTFIYFVEHFTSYSSQETGPTLIPGGSSGGGGMTGGVIPPKDDMTINCWEYWTCTEWSKCTNGTQTRNCSDLNKCNTFESKPSETKQCTTPVKEEPKTSGPVIKMSNLIKEQIPKSLNIKNTKIQITPILIGIMLILILIGMIVRYNKKYLFNMEKKRCQHKRNLFSTFVTIIFLITILLFVYKAELTGLIIAGNQSNSLPVWTGDYTFVINQDSNLTIDLNNYFNNSDKDTLTYLATANDKIDVIIENSLLTIIPVPDFIGERSINILANDEFDTVSVKIKIIVTEEETSNISKASINDFEIENKIKDINNKSVGRKIKDEESFETIFTTIQKNESELLLVFYHNSSIEQPVWIEENVNYTLSKKTAQHLEEITLIVPKIKGIIPKFKLHIGTTSEIFEFGKTIPEIIFNGNSTLIDRDDEKIDVELITENSKAEITGIDAAEFINAKIDSTTDEIIKTKVFSTNNLTIDNATIILEKDSKINAIMECPDFNLITNSCPSNWIKTNIPFTDNETHIKFTVTHFSGYGGAEIEILNIQSYPELYGNWTVMFNTTGTANLTIKASNGTTWSNTNEDNDLKFLELKCGDTILNPEWINNSVFIQNYNCTQTSYETSKVLTTGKHTLQFTFGDNTAYAYNDVIDHCGVQINTSTTLTSDLTASGTCIEINNNSVTLDCNGFNITGDTTGPLIYASKKHGLKIQNCKFYEADPVIQFEDVNDSIIENTRIEKITAFSFGGLDFSGNRNVTFKNNTVLSSDGYFGIYVRGDSYNFYIFNSTITVNEDSALTVYIEESYNSVIKENNIINNDNYATAITLYDSTGINITSNNISNNYNGIITIPAEDIRVENNIINNNEGPAGIWFYGGNNLYAINNTINNIATYGVWLNKAKSVFIENNTIKNHLDYGLKYDETNNTIIRNNYIDNTSVGIFILDGHNFTIELNSISNCTNKTGSGIKDTEAGIRITAGQQFTQNITIINNSLQDNRNGISVYQKSKEIVIANNSLINNHFAAILSIYGENTKIEDNIFRDNNKNSLEGKYFDIYTNGSKISTLSDKHNYYVTLPSGAKVITWIESPGNGTHAGEVLVNVYNSTGTDVTAHHSDSFVKKWTSVSMFSVDKEATFNFSVSALDYVINLETYTASAGFVPTNYTIYIVPMLKGSIELLMEKNTTITNNSAKDFNKIFLFNSTAITIYNLSQSDQGKTLRAINSMNTSLQDIELENAEFEILNKGNINFSENISITAKRTLEDIMNISDNRIYIDTLTAPEFNKSAILTIKNLTYSVPSPIMDLDDDGTFEFCPTSICTWLDYSDGDFSFSTTHFSSYSSQELQCGATITNSTILSQNISGSGTCITIGASNITLDCAGYNITGDGTGNGIEAHGKTNVTIRNCNVQSFYWGIIYNGTNSSRIINSTVDNSSSYGIYIPRSQYDNLENLSVINGSSYAVYFSSSNHNKLYNSVLKNNTGSHGIYDYRGINNTHSRNNISVENGFGRGVSYSYTINNTLDRNLIIDSSFSGVYVAYSIGSKIYSNTVNNSNRYGIQVLTCSDTKIENNTVFNLPTYEYSASYNINIGTSNNTKVHNNHLRWQEVGISTSYCRMLNITNNIITDHGNASLSTMGAVEWSAGIRISSSYEKVWIYNNTISNNFFGIYVILLGMDVNISSNTLTNNSIAGIFAANLVNSTIEHNTIQKSGNQSDAGWFTPLVYRGDLVNDSDTDEYMINISESILLKSTIFSKGDGQKTGDFSTRIYDENRTAIENTWGGCQWYALSYGISRFLSPGIYNISAELGDYLINLTMGTQTHGITVPSNYTLYIYPAARSSMEIIGGDNLVFRNNTINTSYARPVIILNTTNLVLINNTIYNKASGVPAYQIINTRNISLTNITLDTPTVIETQDIGKINFSEDIEITTPRILQDILNINHNQIHVDSATAPEFNKSAILTFKNLSFTNPEPTIDLEDDGSFYTCPANICTERSYSDGTFVYSVPHFTGYSSQETVISIPGGSSGGRGGMPGGVIPPKSDIIDCWEYWTCSDWTECINGTQTRNCSDLNKCSTFESKPSETKQCIMPAKEEPKTSRPITKIANVIKEIPQKEITISNTRIKIIPIIIGVIFILLLISIIAKYNKKYVFNKNKSIKKNSRKKKK